MNTLFLIPENNALNDQTILWEKELTIEANTSVSKKLYCFSAYSSHSQQPVDILKYLQLKTFQENDLIISLNSTQSLFENFPSALSDNNIKHIILSTNDKDRRFHTKSLFETIDTIYHQFRVNSSNIYIHSSIGLEPIALLVACVVGKCFTANDALQSLEHAYQQIGIPELKISEIYRNQLLFFHFSENRTNHLLHIKFPNLSLPNHLQHLQLSELSPVYREKIKNMLDSQKQWNFDYLYNNIPTPPRTPPKQLEINSQKNNIIRTSIEYINESASDSTSEHSPEVALKENKSDEFDFSVIDRINDSFNNSTSTNYSPINSSRDIENKFNSVRENTDEESRKKAASRCHPFTKHFSSLFKCTSKKNQSE